jgi:hypothetical protein
MDKMGKDRIPRMIYLLPVVLPLVQWILLRV